MHDAGLESTSCFGDGSTHNQRFARAMYDICYCIRCEAEFGNRKVKQSTTYERAQTNRDRLCAARIFSLLDSVRAMQEAGSSCRLREVLGQHALALLRELVPA